MLPVRPQKFVTYYLGKAKGNGTLAATMAGYKNPAVAASRLIRNDKVRRLIESRLSNAAMDAEEVLIRISRRAESTAADFMKFDPDGSSNALPSLDLRGARRKGSLDNIKKLKANRTPGNNPLEVVEVELHDALAALAMLAKYHGLNNPKAEEAKDALKPRIVLPDSDARPEAHADDARP